MIQMVTTVRVTPRETRVMVQDETGDRLIARLPPLSGSHRWALRTLLEALALWNDRRLRVVLFVDDSCDWDRLGLVDALGLGNETLHFDVEITPQEGPQCPRPQRLTGLGSFARERRSIRR